MVTARAAISSRPSGTGTRSARSDAEMSATRARIASTDFSDRRTSKYVAPAATATMTGAVVANRIARVRAVASTASLPPPTSTVYTPERVATFWPLTRMSSPDTASSGRPRRRVKSKSAVGTNGVAGAEPDRLTTLPSGPINWVATTRWSVVSRALSSSSRKSACSALAMSRTRSAAA